MTVTPARASGANMDRGVTRPMTEAAAFRVFGSTYTIKARLREYTLMEIATPPGSASPPLINHSQDTLICVLEGEYEVSGERLGAGSCAFIARGTVLAMSVAGGGSGRCHVILTPPGAAEGFIEGVGVSVADGGSFAPGMEAILESAGRHGIEFLTTPV